MLTGFEQRDNTTIRPFNPDPNHYKPTSVTGAPASSYQLALTDPNFKFPQVWRTDLAVDKKLPYGLVGTAEFLYGRDVNGIYYINANLAPANPRFCRGRRTSTLDHRKQDQRQCGKCCRSQEREHRPFLEHRRVGGKALHQRIVCEGGVRLRAVEKHRRSGIHCVRIMGEQ